MKRRIITFGKYFNEFITHLTSKEREKIDYAQKTPKKEIDKAIMIKKEYYEYKRKYDSEL